MGVGNAEFLKGYIEDIPLPDESIDAVISNCVINLSDDKERALSEAFRVLKKDGRFAIAVIVRLGELPEAMWKKVAMWSSCLAGTLKVEDYKSILKKVGFQDIELQLAHIYDQAAIEALMDSDPTLDTPENRNDIDVVAGVFTGAYVRAKK